MRLHGATVLPMGQPVQLSPSVNLTVLSIRFGRVPFPELTDETENARATGRPCSLVPQRDVRVNAGGMPRREVRGQRRGAREQCCGKRNSGRISRREAEEKTRKELGRAERQRKTDDDSDGHHPGSLSKNQLDDAYPRRAERQPDADFRSAMSDLVGQHAVQS